MIKYKIIHDMPGRLRIRYGRYAFDKEKALGLKYTFMKWDIINDVQVNDVTGSVLFYYDQTQKNQLIQCIDSFDVDSFDDYQQIIESYHFELEQQEIKQRYMNKFINLFIKRYIVKWFLPSPLQKINTVYNAYHYIYKGMKSLTKGKVDVSVLDATSISVSMLNHNFNTARNIMFLLSISELLEDYTKKKTSLQLKENLSLHIDKVWILSDGIEQEIATSTLNIGDVVVVRMGSMIPVDGEIVDGSGMVNESSFTGEPLSKAVKVGSSVFAGTVVEQGKIYVKVRNLSSDSRFSKIVDMIDTNESLKANIQSQAEHLADAIVPYSFLSFFGLLLLTRSLSRASSVLLVDYSCAIKLSTSISVISAMQEATKHSIIIKGGKYLEAMAHADTIVFDKTGTLTNATPTLQEVIPLHGYSRNEVLKIAACLEEHFPHSVANAIVNKAKEEHLLHEEEHAEVKYIIAHGIATTLYGKRAIIGSEHFIFEDEHIEKTKEIQDIILQLQNKGCHSLIYLAIGDDLVGIISIYDPLKKEAKQVITNLKEVGFSNIIMLTGDCENAARYIANELGITEYKSEVLPEDKADYIHKLKSEGKRVVMVGDGVNDTPALSSADVSISMQDSSAIARELADITLTSSCLDEIVVLKQLSELTIHKIKTQYRYIVTFNSLLILNGIIGLLKPSTSALLHNTSTFIFAANSTRPLLKNLK